MAMFDNDFGRVLDAARFKRAIEAPETGPTLDPEAIASAVEAQNNATPDEDEGFDSIPDALAGREAPRKRTLNVPKKREAKVDGAAAAQGLANFISLFRKKG